jgi:hypothetical protein
MTAWSAFFPDVLVDVPGAPEPIVTAHLVRAARKLCRRAQVWLVWLDPVTTTGVDYAEYDIELPTGATLFQLYKTTLDGRDYPTISHRVKKNDVTLYDDAQKGLVSSDMVSFIMPPGTAAGSKVQIQAVLMPSVSATTIPDLIYERYLECIAAGAKASLMQLPDTTFYKPNDAAIEEARFEQGINKASLDTFRGMTKNVPRNKVNWC